ncbi:valine--tRNA ligase [Candidatus Saccharibacteria bacterium]|nr:valine--tRNA ligase [Candidatus Saccharibacteria bacterium]
MSLPKAYEPKKYETDIYNLWEQGGAFEPKRQGSDGYFSMVMPPPNANADLHIGFGLTIAIEDTLVRYQRMQGKNTLFIPGADHAGFETWVVYEKRLQEQGKSRFDFSREELYKQVWDFVEQNKTNFQSQIRAMGASCDWTRFTYTLDDKVVKQAYQTFQKMWQDGLIYRGKRIVNYCTFHGTSFSDIEVVHQEEGTQLWQIAYPLAEPVQGIKEVVIATTRPETKLGQSALMVNPKDKRYKELVGREVHQPLVPGKPIKIISDEHVDMTFGTGVVTVTPGHDPDDFDVAQRHSLPIIELITTDGKMSRNVPQQFRGMAVLEAREAVAEELAKKGFLRGVESYTHSVGKCYKCGTTIEPLALEQWFVNMQSLAKPAIEVLEAKKIEFYPDSQRRQLIGYLKQLRDWNISRQIAWGIPIPAFQNVSDPKDWIFDERVSQESIEINGKTYRRDPDVFDTWFSSGHWPLVTLNYPDDDDFKAFYPTSLMETAGEILHQWVARMIMLGLYLTGDIPFKDVYIHGLVLAEGGAKMSKSLGNMIDAMETINSHGSDALRMGLIAGRAAAVNRGYDQRRVGEARNFCNKLWNVARFIESQGATSKDVDFKPQSPADHWILNMLSICQEAMAGHLNNYRLSEAYESLYHFVWDDLADWYVEASKVQPNPAFSRYLLEQTLKLAHPFAPFVTEAIWQALWNAPKRAGNADSTGQAMSGTPDQMLISQIWDKITSADAKQAERFETVKSMVSEIRKISSALNLTKPRLFYDGEDGELIARLANLSAVEATEKPSGLKLTSTEAWLAVDAQTAQKYLIKLNQQKAVVEQAVKRLEARLKDKNYLAKAPKELVAETKAQLAEAQTSLRALYEDLTKYQNFLG